MSPTSTSENECDVRVVMRRNTIEPVRSEISQASRAMSKASCESEGSSVTARANRCSTRLSCSFCEECMPGSSAETTTSPPFVPSNV